ncbi:ribosomal protection tetracycline resistance protein [Actinoplanes octamycinicus]|uniref:Ribosomal protection tetracycline resistance protein n=1 Tax=Actinoplanes octamycinicus TaxID=135948 RepID=A0A7W7GZV4_9ACTN|nr:TetM/TetW/TetO/TetS family tetracycline resistance ribosomal protection protein [Actinoplanes octamycinicus]MBB4741299.1 ribosomal protection tetracycline resistance protein [Actinoplanes octamycinicus]GIE62900.1 tetracycline resistance protein, tetM/tetO subfamily [Actinoplanes octamycinicus]
MSILNLGILAHVDAGKTSLTERLLHTAGVIDEIGSVDDGSTQTDTLELERRRGITIKSAVVSFTLDGRTVNLIDTPGHPDFIAEVERSLAVLDAAILVVSAVEGVQAQTRVLARTLHRLRIPTLLFVNKVDRAGARFSGVLNEIGTRISPAIVPMSRVDRIGARDAEVHGAIDLTRLADHDDAVLAALVEDRPAPPIRVRGRVHPVYFGSAITGAGIDDLVRGITRLLPPAPGHAAGPPIGTIFKVERGPAGERLAYLRMFSGTLHVRDMLGDERVTGIEVFTNGAARACGAITAGQIGRVRGLGSARVGADLGVRDEPAPPPEDDASFVRRKAARRAQFAPPSLETAVVASRRAERGALHAALAELAEQDPLINLRQDDERQEIYVSLYGEVQKEVVGATLAEQYGLRVSFRETTTLHVERVLGVGAAVEFNKVAPNPFLATIGLRVAPAPVGAGVSFGLEVEPGSMPPAFFTAVEQTVHETLRQGLRGWPVPDVLVAMTHSGYSARQSHAHAIFDKSMSSTAGDFRNLTPLVLMAALRRAGTDVLEPIHTFRAEVPPDTVPAVLPLLARLRAIPLSTEPAVISGEIPAARVHELQRRLPGLTRGEGVLESAFDHYAPVRGPIPSRARTGPDPLDRKEYLLRVLRRTGASAAAR